MSSWQINWTMCVTSSITFLHCKAVHTCFLACLPFAVQALQGSEFCILEMLYTRQISWLLRSFAPKRVLMKTWRAVTLRQIIQAAVIKKFRERHLSAFIPARVRMEHLLWPWQRMNKQLWDGDSSRLFPGQLNGFWIHICSLWCLRNTLDV